MPQLCGKDITRNGLGLMRFTNPLSPMPDEQAIRLLKAALDNGINVWNGADFYGTPENNSLHLMSRYFAAHPEDSDKVVLTIKTGVVELGTFSIDCSPEFMRASVARANAILGGRKKIDLFGPARVDKKVPIEDTVGALKDLVEKGDIGGIQLSEVSAETILRAAKVATIHMVEQEVSLWADDIFHNGVASTCAELGLVVVAHTPLGAGFLTGRIKTPNDLPAGDHHRFFPRFQPDNLTKNLELVMKLEKIAQTKHCTTAQLALSWIKVKGMRDGMPVLVPVFGASSEARIAENAATISLSNEDMDAIDDLLSKFEVAGARYPAPAMVHIDG